MHARRNRHFTVSSRRVKLVKFVLEKVEIYLKMGCVFSRKQALSFRKKRKIPKTHDTKTRGIILPSDDGTKPVINKPVGRPVIKSKGSKLIYENIRQEYSTLAFLMGGKNFSDPELVFKEEKPATLKDPEVLPVPSIVPACPSHEDEDLSSRQKLPDSVTYEGFHQYGFHLMTVDAEKFSSSVENSAAIVCGISSIIGRERCIVVFKQDQGKTAYLPDIAAQGWELFHTLSTELGEQLIRIVFHKPSWFVQASLADSLFSEEAMRKLVFTKTIIELGKLTGFPGQIHYADLIKLTLISINLQKHCTLKYATALVFHLHV
ncbi:uncharacterized protein LOC144632708 isoform X1 [Oculina patagonica]